MVLVGVIVSAVVFLNYVIAAERGLGETLRASLTVMVADVRHDMRDVVGASCLISLMPLFYQWSTDEVTAVWESSCPEHVGWTFRWRVRGAAEWRTVGGIVSQRATEGHIVHRLLLKRTREMDWPDDIEYSLFNSRGVVTEPRRFRWPPPSSASLPAAAAPASVRLALISDNQSGAAVFRRLLAHMAQHGLPDLLLHGGDSVQSGSLQKEYETYLYGPLLDSGLAAVPLAYCRGNHDDRGLAVVYSNTHGIAEKYFAISIGHAHIIVLNSNRDRVAMHEWFLAQLASPEFAAAAFRIVLVHIPPFIEYWEPVVWRNGENRWGSFVRETYVPLFEAHGVDLVVGGHSHIYQRGTRNGVTYAIIGGGGGALEEDPPVEDYGFYSVTRREHHYVSLEVDATTLRWQARNLEDEEMDAFERQRRAG